MTRTKLIKKLKRVGQKPLTLIFVLGQLLEVWSVQWLWIVPALILDVLIFGDDE